LNSLVLDNLGYEPPNIVADTIGNLNVVWNGSSYQVWHDNELWLVHNPSSLQTVMEFYSHYSLAEGYVLCTGLGLGIRENWLIRKPEVTKLTCVEINKEIIDYHYRHNPQLMERIEVIHADANEYIGECDTLLIDHYENESWEEKLDMVEKCSSNIRHNRLWFWCIESMLTEIPYSDLRQRFPTLPDLSRNRIEHFLTMYFNTTP